MTKRTQWHLVISTKCKFAGNPLY